MTRLTVREWLDYRKTSVGVPKDASDDYPLTKDHINGLMYYLKKDTGGSISQFGFDISTLGKFRAFLEAFI